jgi:hypothetical protein
MTNASGVAVIATSLARTDRRALSEAWYSALHLAHASPALHADAPRAGAPLLPRMPQTRAGESATAGHRMAAQPARERASHNERAQRENLVERRQPACADTRRIERAVKTLTTRWNGDAAQTVDIGGGRVRLLVRADRGTTRIVAVCAAPLRETVERALAQARFALAAP